MHSSSELIDYFKNHPKSDTTSLLRIFKIYEKKLDIFDDHERLIVLDIYGDALFEGEIFDKYVSIGHQILELSISANIQFIEGKDIFIHTLRQMSKANYYLHDIEQAVHIGNELLKIKYDKSVRDLIIACQYESEEFMFLQNVRSIIVATTAVILIIMTSTILFLTDNTTVEKMLRCLWVTLGSVLLVWGTTELLTYGAIRKKINLQSQRTNRREKETALQQY